MDDPKRKLHLWGRLLVVGVAVLGIFAVAGVAKKVRAKPDRDVAAATAGAATGQQRARQWAPARAKVSKRLRERPNVILIMTDDQAAHTVTPEAMPNLHRLLISRGTSFSDYVVTTPLCCPSRATTLTGQYVHNNGVLRNNYKLLRQKRNVLPVWLQRAGYRTAHIGKWLNGYEKFAYQETTPAPGWDRWFTQLKPRQYYNWTASLNGTLKSYGTDDDDHLINVVNARAKHWTRQLANGSRPFYMQLDYYAPHIASGRDKRCGQGPVPAPRDEGTFGDEPLPRPPSFNEADVSDKPPQIRSLPEMDQAQIDKAELRYRCTLEVLRSVDRGIKAVYNQVKRARELRKTVFIFTSDNGYFYGEHRIPGGKKYPYDEDVRMPLTIVAPPAVRKGARVARWTGAPAANIDLAPTILDLAGAKPCMMRRRCRTMDGRSMRPLLDGRAASWPDPRAIGLEIGTCTYRGVRFKTQMYLEYANEARGGCSADTVEHYDLGLDPYQLQNLYPAASGSKRERLQMRLRRKTSKLRECAGLRGRDERPPSGHFCR